MKQRLKLYNRVPPNGLVLYCGTVLTDEGKEKQVHACTPSHSHRHTDTHHFLHLPALDNRKFFIFFAFLPLFLLTSGSPRR